MARSLNRLAQEVSEKKYTLNLTPEELRVIEYALVHQAILINKRILDGESVSSSARRNIQRVLNHIELLLDNEDIDEVVTLYNSKAMLELIFADERPTEEELDTAVNEIVGTSLNSSSIEAWLKDITGEK